MTTVSEPKTSAFNASRFLPVLLILFTGSGCAALIYEIVWYQLLVLAIGSNALSLAVVLATFMGGLCIGSVIFPRMNLKGRHPLRLYALMEIGIAAYGLLVLAAMPYLNKVYIAGSMVGMPGMLLRGLICVVCLLPPTIMMGASLPAIVRWIESTPRGVSWWGLLYGGNTAGAVFGCLLAGFYLLRLYDVYAATYVAAAINLGVATLSWMVAARTPAHASVEQHPEETSGQAEAQQSPALPSLGGQSPWPVYITTALSGACALGAEVIWTRLMGMMLGATVYVFAIILAVFLIGLALGSFLGARIKKLDPRAALGWCQILLTLGIAWTAFMIADSLPYWPVNVLLAADPWKTFQLDLARCLWAILPPAVLWGASFPLAFAAVAGPGEDSGMLVGTVYAANTFGAIIGALSTSLILIPWIGTQQTQRLLLVLSALSALFVLLPYIGKTKSRPAIGWLAASLALAGFLAYSVDAVPGELIAYGRRMSISTGSKVLYTAEGRTSSVAITLAGDGAVEVDVNGHVEATSEIYDMKLQRMVGHLPGLLHPNPKSVLGIGFGAGVSAGTFTRYPGIEHITVCEIEPVIPPTSTRYFAQFDYDVYHNPRTRIVYDDARHYVLTTPNKYDIIASDPLDVFVKGTAALYSKEYFQSVKEHLNPGGMFTLYVPLYESDERTVQSEVATFFEVFPYGTLWANTRDGLGYDMVFMGQAEPLKINLDEVQARLERPDYAPVLQSLKDIGVESAYDLFSTYAGRKTDLAPWLEGAMISRDRDLRLQYIGGWGINSQMEDYLYRQMMQYRKLPMDIFDGSKPESLQAMVASLMSVPGAVAER